MFERFKRHKSNQIEAPLEPKFQQHYEPTCKEVKALIAHITSKSRPEPLIISDETLKQQDTHIKIIAMAKEFGFNEYVAEQMHLLAMDIILNHRVDECERQSMEYCAYR